MAGRPQARGHYKEEGWEGRIYRPRWADKSVSDSEETPPSVQVRAARI